MSFFKITAAAITGPAIAPLPTTTTPEKIFLKGLEMIYQH